METAELTKKETNGVIKHKLPTIAELLRDVDGIDKTEGLNAILNTRPPENWVKVHPYIPGHRYLPIDKIEYLLRKIFKKYRIEVRKTGMLMNAVEVTVRVWYLDPSTNTMEYHDGVGACELQTEAKTGPLKMDMSNVNKGAVQMALPIAKTVAVKDACDHFGEIFGCNLNRKDTLLFVPDHEILNKAATKADKETERVTILLKEAKTRESLQALTDFITTEEQKAIYQQRITELK